MIGFGLSPFLAVHGGTTSDPDQLRTEIELTAAVGIAGPSTTITRCRLLDSDWSTTDCAGFD